MAGGSSRSRALIVLGASVFALVLASPASSAAKRPVVPSTRSQLSHSSAENFFLQSVRDKLRGNWARAWESLYPFHQRIATRDTFVRCEARTPFPAPLESLHVVDVRAAAVRVPGLRRTVPGVAVGVEVALRWYGPRDPIVFRHTFHLIPVHGRWTWLLSPSRYRLYRSGACGADERTTAHAGWRHPGPDGDRRAS